jgi:hypothetical protein
MATIQRRGRARVIGGGVITAPALVTLDASGKFVTYTHDATKFGMVCGYAATDCSGDAAYFDLVIAPMMIGPANATGVNMTLSGDLTVDGVIQATDGTVNVTGGLTATTAITAADLAATDDLTVGDDAAITGLLTVGETLGVTGVATFTAGVVLNGGMSAADGTIESSSHITLAASTLTAEQLTSTDDATITGMLSVGEHIDITEEVEPAAPAANTGRLFCVDSGAGKTILKVRFASGASQTIATEP